MNFVSTYKKQEMNNNIRTFWINFWCKHNHVGGNMDRNYHINFYIVQYLVMPEQKHHGCKNTYGVKTIVMFVRFCKISPVM